VVSSIGIIDLQIRKVLTINTLSLSTCLSTAEADTIASMRSLVHFLTLSSIITGSLAATAKPALILVPGAFHRASVYDEVKAQLADVGYEHIDAVDLPSVGDDVADVERKSDTNVVTGLLETRLNNGQDVVLVGNSYGATVIMEAVKEFEDRSAVSAPSTAEGEGRVLGLVMVSTHFACLCG
jgi:pimeloyl-ACP methyl ester carboxylesterase